MSDLAKETALLQLAPYPLVPFAGFDEENWRNTGLSLKVAAVTLGDRHGLEAKDVRCRVAKAGLTVVELTDGRVALLWEGHGELHASMDDLVQLCRAGRASGNNGPISPLNAFEFDRLLMALEGE